MSQLALRLAIEPQRSLAYTSLSGTYAALGTALANASRKLLFVNGTDAVVTFSDDGVTDKFTLLPSSGFVLDEALNHQGDYTAKGTRFYVMTSGSPTTGSVYLSTWYGVQ